jgi:enediyne biosynthesis protein E4
VKHDLLIHEPPRYNGSVNRACASSAAIVLGLSACSREPDSPRPPAAPAESAKAPPSAAPQAARWFVDVTAELGLPADFGTMPDGQYALPEIMGPGVALFDCDNDGDLDLLERRCPPPGHPRDPAPDRLWRREADGRYVDVSESSKLHDPGFGQGVAIGDVDNDGDQDVYCANLFHDAFYSNHGDGTFTEATEAAGFAAAGGWNCSAAFFDADRDGDLDLFVAHYVEYEPTTVCRNATSAQEYCGPKSYTPVVSSLWRNDGSGRFKEESGPSGLRSRGAGLGVVCADLTGDGWPDVYVANDASENHLWVNRGDGTFAEEGLERGVALNRYGKPEGSMGIAIGDVDGNGFYDLMVTNIVGENNTLYLGDAGHAFQDSTPHAGMSRYDLPTTGFGCGFFDLELDGDLDVAVVNGRVRRGPKHESAALTPFWDLYAEPNFLFVNQGDASFEDAAAQAGDFTRRAEVSRALAFADLDGDGDLDLVKTQVLGPLRVFRNDAPRRGHWLLVRARTGKRDALGADVVVRCGAKSFRSLCLAAASYATSDDPRAHFGLGANGSYDRLEVTWPSGRRELFAGGAADRVIEVVEGEGKAP